jgi:hypothetical protein
MLTAGLGIWAVTALSHAIPHSEHTVAWLAAVALITAGACCGVLMIVVLLGSAGRNAERAEPSWPAGPRQRGPLPPGAQLPGPPRPGPRMPPPGPPTVPPGGPPPSARPGRPAGPSGPGGSQPGPGGPRDPGMPLGARPSPDAGQLTGTWTAPGLEQPGGTEVETGSEQILHGWAVPGPGPGSEPADWPADAELPPGDERWSPDPAYHPDDGPELADWPDPPAGGGPGFAAGEWSGPDGGFTPQADGGFAPPADGALAAHPDAGFAPHSEPVADGWAGPDDGTSGQAGWAGPDNGATPHDAVAADGWTTADAGLRPGAVLGQGEWTVREPEADLDAGPGPVTDPGPPPASPQGLNLWPGQEPALPAETPASPAAEQPAKDDDADELPRRVESAFNVWGRRNPAPAPDADPAAPPAGTVPAGTAPAGRVPAGTVPASAASPDTASPDTASPDTAPADAAPTDRETAGPATPLAADPDQPDGSTRSTRDWVQHAAAQLRDADLLPHRGLLPDADLRPAAGLLPPVPPQPAEPAADVLEPVDDEVEQDPILRPPAPRRRTAPAPGWNPDSEEDWLRVLRGLRGPEDS